MNPAPINFDDMGDLMTPSDALGSIRKVLARLLKDHPAEENAINQILRLLDKVEHAVSPPKVPAGKRTGEHTTYSVRIANRQPILSETRGGQVMRVDYDLFNSVVAVLRKSDQPLPFDEIVAGVSTNTKVRPVEWQVRVVLRFLLRADPPVLRHSRSRYFPVDQKTFSHSALSWWQSSETR
jgi:hypothetical protein